MRLFVDGLLPGLRLAPPALPTPWILPSQLNRAHRERLIFLLTQALRGSEPDLVVADLSWGERGILHSDRLRLLPPVLYILRVDTPYPTDPREVLRLGSRLIQGPVVFDFADPHELPALGWLGPLRLEVLRCLTDLLLSRCVLPAAESIIDTLKTLCEQVLSPIDLIDAADELVERVAEGRALEAAVDRAAARILLSRFPGLELSTDLTLRALTEFGMGREPAPQHVALFSRAGLFEGGQALPPAALLKRPGVLRRVLGDLARRYHPQDWGRHLREYAPDLFPIVAPPFPGGVGRPRHERLRPLDPWPQVDVAAIEVTKEPLLRVKALLASGEPLQAARILQQGVWVQGSTEALAAARLWLAAAAETLVRDVEGSRVTFERAALLFQIASMFFSVARMGSDADPAVDSDLAAQAANARYMQGLALLYWHRDDRALEAFQLALQTAREVAQPRLIIQCLVGLLDAGEGRDSERLQWVQEAQSLAAQLGDPRVQAWVENHFILASPVDVPGDLRKKVLPIYEQLGDLRAQAAVLTDIAEHYEDRGEKGSAIRVYEEEILPLYKKLGDHEAQAEILQRVALYEQPQQAIALLEGKALPTSLAAGGQAKAAKLRHLIANLCVHEGRLDQALRLYERDVLPAYQALDDRYRLTLGRMAAAYAYRQREQPGDEERVVELLTLAREDAHDLRLPELATIEKMLSPGSIA